MQACTRRLKIRLKIKLIYFTSLAGSTMTWANGPEEEALT